MSVSTMLKLSKCLKHTETTTSGDFRVPQIKENYSLPHSSLQVQEVGKALESKWLLLASGRNLPGPVVGAGVAGTAPGR